MSCSKYAEDGLPVAREKLPQDMRAAEKDPPGPPGSLPEEAPSASWGIIGGYSPGLRPGLPGIVSRLRPAMAMEGIAGVKQRAGCPHGCVTQPTSQQWPWMALLA